jgi:hypothetical protein
MERKRYLELCQKYAVGENIKVKYKDTEYHPYRYELSFSSNGKVVHTAILKDRKANSVIFVKLESVEG